jgi:hypothetical protein
VLTYGKVLSILATRGVTPTRGAVALRDTGDGPFLAVWDDTALGPRPTDRELDAVTDAAATDAILDEQATFASPLLMAIAKLDFEERQKLVVQDGQRLLDEAACRARVKAIYKALTAR